MQSSESDISVEPRVRHYPDQERFRAIRSDEVHWRPFPAFPRAWVRAGAARWAIALSLGQIRRSRR